MISRIYVAAWLLILAAAALTYITGNFDDLTFTIFGFLFSTLFFTGLVGVLPWWVNQRQTWSY
jgi:hypothetical protein